MKNEPSFAERTNSDLIPRFCEFRHSNSNTIFKSWKFCSCPIQSSSRIFVKICLFELWNRTDRTELYRRHSKAYQRHIWSILNLYYVIISCFAFKERKESWIQIWMTSFYNRNCIGFIRHDAGCWVLYCETMTFPSDRLSAILFRIEFSSTFV